MIIPPDLAVFPAALQDAEAARQTGPEHCGDIRNLRHLIWFSIDNDDTRDLDQLRVPARPPEVGGWRWRCLDLRRWTHTLTNTYSPFGVLSVRSVTTPSFVENL